MRWFNHEIKLFISISRYHYHLIRVWIMALHNILFCVALYNFMLITDLLCFSGYWFSLLRYILVYNINSCIVRPLNVSLKNDFCSYSPWIIQPQLILNTSFTAVRYCNTGHQLGHNSYQIYGLHSFWHKATPK